MTWGFCNQPCFAAGPCCSHCFIAQECPLNIFVASPFFRQLGVTRAVLREFLSIVKGNMRGMSFHSHKHIFIEGQQISCKRGKGYIKVTFSITIGFNLVSITTIIININLNVTMYPHLNQRRLRPFVSGWSGVELCRESTNFHLHYKTLPTRPHCSQPTLLPQRCHTSAAAAHQSPSTVEPNLGLEPNPQTLTSGQSLIVDR